MRRLLFPVLCSAILLTACESGSDAATGEAGSDPVATPQPETMSETMPDPMSDPAPSSDSFHSLSTHTLEGQPVSLDRYRGKALLVVNVASRCGLTPQYEGLQALHEEIGGEDFAIVAFPSNDFGGQEPGTPSEIREFCSTNYDVSFDVMEKVSTKSGPIYDWLNEKTGSRPSWNFSKYLVSKDGTTVRFFDPRTEPSDTELRNAIDELRNAN